MKKRTFVTALVVMTLVLSIMSLYATPVSACYEKPKVEIWKKFVDDPLPSYSLGTEYYWDIEIGVWTSINLRSAKVYDRFGAELKIDNIQTPDKTYTFTYLDYETKYPTREAYVSISDGTTTITRKLDWRGATFGDEPYKFRIFWTGESHKVQFRWDIGELNADETITIIVGVSTDLNPGGKQEYTSTCEHCINSGAVLKAKYKYKCRWACISAESEKLCVKVECGPPTAKLIIKKFNDTNGDGRYDEGIDIMLTGWEIDVTDPDGLTISYNTPINLDITNFGIYTITEDLPGDWEQTAVRVNGVYKDPPTITVTVEVNEGEKHCVLYGNKEIPPPPPAKLILDKFNDTNGNGIYDAGDVKIVDWRIDVMNPHGGTTTYLTPRVVEITEFGTYTITEDLPSGWEQTAVEVNGIYKEPHTLTVVVEIHAGETHNVLYGNRKIPEPRPAKLILDKFNDTNGNGVFDEGIDIMLTGWQIDVRDPDGITTSYFTPEVVDITNFGTYTITETLPGDWEQTALRVNGVYITPTVETTLDINEGETRDVLYGNKVRAPPPPPPPIGITLRIRPISVYVGSLVTFSWVIESPPEVTPVSVELYLRNPGSVIIPLQTYTNFPTDFTGSYTWTATTPPGLWRVYVDYYYTYFGVEYRMRAYGSFNVRASAG